MMMPALIIGIALLVYFVRLLDLPLSLGTVILGHLLIAQPFVILIVYARLATFDWAAVESARDLGASPLTAFRTVTLPIIQPTIVGAALIALSISLDDFVITFFTIGGGNTLADPGLGHGAHLARPDHQCHGDAADPAQHRLDRSSRFGSAATADERRFHRQGGAGHRRRARASASPSPRRCSPPARRSR